MRKTLALLLTILLCLTGAFSLAEEAGEVVKETFTCEEYEYALLDDGTAEITKYHGEAETLEVPGELDGYAVTRIGDGAFYGCFGLTDVTIPGSVTAIGDGVFFGCFDLTDVTIPGSVTAIGDSAFAFCYGLTAITIPDSVTAIGNDAFFYCGSLTAVTIPDSVTIIGDDAFSDCDSLTGIFVGRDSYAKQYCIDHDLPYA